MGCWNGSCALTGLPVFSGDPVYVFFLLGQVGRIRADEDDQYISNLCHPTTFFKPLPYHFEAKYNDYGSVEDVKETRSYNLLLEVIKSHLFEMEQGKNESHDIPVTRDKFDFDLLMQADHENRLFLFDNAWLGKQPLEHIIIRKNVLDSLLAEFKYEVWKNGKDVEYSFEEVEEAVWGYIEPKLKKLAKRDPDSMDRSLLRNDITDSGIDLKHGTPEAFFRTLSYELRFTWVDWPLERLIQMADDLKDAREHLHQLMVYGWLNRYMTNARRMWIPMSGAGSQDSETKAHKLMANITLFEADEIDRRWDEEDEDEE